MISKNLTFSFNHKDQRDKLYEIMTSQDIKNNFDSRAEELKTYIYNMVDDLSSTTGSQNIGYRGITVYSKLDSIDTEITAARQGKASLLANLNEIRELLGGTGDGHTHSNKTILDNVTNTNITNWNTAYTHSQSTHAPTTAQKNSDITKAEIEAKLIGDIPTHTHSSYSPTSHTHLKANITDFPTKLSEFQNDIGAGGTGGTGDGHTHDNMSTLNNLTQFKLEELDSKPSRFEFESLSNDVSNNTSSLAEITQNFNDHLANHPSGGEVDLSTNPIIIDILRRLGILESNLPKEKIYNLPVVNLMGSMDGISADVKVTLDTELLDVYGEPIYTNKKCTLKWQGASSLLYPKKNFSYTLFENDSSTKFTPLMFNDVSSENKYHLKANYIDYTHARNIVVARLTKENYINNLSTNARGCIDGFPVIVNINGEKQGIYTFNLSQTGNVYGLDNSNPNHLMYRAELNYPNHTCGFRELSTKNTEWEDRFPETDTSENRAKLNRLISFVKDSDDTTFRNNFSQYMNLEYAIDYWLWCYFLGLTDSLARNMNIVTYDGDIWYPTFYDMDNCFGYGFSGVQPPTVKCPEEYQCTDSLLWEKLSRVFKNEIKVRYNQLRSGKMTKAYIYEKIKDFMDSIHYSEYAFDQAKWTGIMGREQDLSEIGIWLSEREVYCDGIFNTGDIINIQSVSLSKNSETLNIINEIINNYKATNTIVLNGSQPFTMQSSGTAQGVSCFEYDTKITYNDPVTSTVTITSDNMTTVGSKTECQAGANRICKIVYSATMRILFTIEATKATSVSTLQQYLADNNMTIYINKGNLLDISSYAMVRPASVGSSEWVSSTDATYKTLIKVTEGERYKIVTDGNWSGLYTFNNEGKYLSLLSDSQTKPQTIQIPSGVYYIALKCNNVTSKGVYGHALYKVDSSDNIIYDMEEGGTTITTYESKTLSAILNPSTSTNKNVIWSVNNSNVDIIPNELNCSITAKAEGTSVVTITTEDGNKTDTCNITVSTITS